MRQPYRPPSLSRIPVERMKTYSIRSPVDTHRRPAHCREIGCPQWMNGWTLTLKTGSDDDRFFRRACTGAVDGYRRPFTTTVDNGLTTFHFEAGTPCRHIMKHTVTLDRPEIYIVRGGDWRGSTGLIRRHVRAIDWVEDSALHFDKFARELEKG